MNIKETKELMVFVVDLVNGMIDSMADGEITTGDMFNFVPILNKLPTAFDGIQNVPAELKDLSDEEFEELKSLLADELHIDKKEILDQALTCAFDLWKLYQLLRGGHA